MMWSLLAALDLCMTFLLKLVPFLKSGHGGGPECPSFHLLIAFRGG